MSVEVHLCGFERGAEVEEAVATPGAVDGSGFVQVGVDLASKSSRDELGCRFSDGGNSRVW